MNLQTQISNELWEAIASPYEAGNFTHAILEAMHQITVLLRDRSGVDGDGATLVGQALGGESPKLRVNSFQSESEKNVQRGIEQILRGTYLAIRNPRSHEPYTDSKSDADAIIHFLNYLLTILNASKESFTIETFFESISDPDFVESQRYAEILVAEIPANRRGDAIGALFSQRAGRELRKLRFLISTLLSLLSDIQLAEYLSAVSEELRTTQDASHIRSALQMLTPELWPKLAEVPRLRIENKLIRDVEHGEILSTGKVTGVLGTWSARFGGRFALRSSFASVLVTKLEDTDRDDRKYVASYFFARLPEILTEEGDIKRAVRAIASAIESGDTEIRDATITNVKQFPSNWQVLLVEALQGMTNPANPAIVLNDGTPLLEASAIAEITDDDIPF
ncbi:MAG: TIGR02391 family protein [Terracidiphilus sp.]|jgi:uncharacterized protein (TIGR02391 family)